MTTWSIFDPSTAVNATIAGGGLQITGHGPTNPGIALAYTGHSSGKYYFEETLTVFAGFSYYPGLGVAQANVTPSDITASALKAAMIENWGAGTQFQVNGSQVFANPTTGWGGTVGCAVDLDNKRIWFRSTYVTNWNANGADNPATNTGGYDISGLTFPLQPISCVNIGRPDTSNANFGQNAFVLGSAPAGFTPGWPGGPSPAGGSSERVVWIST